MVECFVIILIDTDCYKNYCDKVKTELEKNKKGLGLSY